MHSLDPQAVSSAFGHSQLATWEWNPTSDEMTWTSGQTTVYAHPVSAINSSAAWFFIVHPDDRERVKSAFERALQSVPGFREHFRVTSKDGKTLWILGYGQLVRLPDQSVRMLGMNMEVTDWVEALAASETRFSATFEQAAVGIAHVGVNGKWINVNRRCCEIVGYSREELLSLTFHELTHPADLHTDRPLIQELMRGERSSYSVEKRYYTKGKRVVWANLTVSLVHKSDGSPDYFIAVIEDITARVRIKAQRDEMIEILEERVRERTAELEKLSMTDALTEVANRRRLDEHRKRVELQRSILDRRAQLGVHVLHGSRKRPLQQWAISQRSHQRRNRRQPNPRPHRRPDRSQTSKCRKGRSRERSLARRTACLR